mgnify:CR=1 FL=1
MNVDELQASMLGNGPQRGEVYRHYKGGLYLVLGQCLREGDLKIEVVYKNLLTGSVWSRTLFDWNEMVLPNDSNEEVSRFEYTGHFLNLADVW